jgi:hypothetical protein
MALSTTIVFKCLCTNEYVTVGFLFSKQEGIKNGKMQERRQRNNSFAHGKKKIELLQD